MTHHGGTSSARAREYRTVCEIASGGMGRVELVVHREGDFVRLYARKRVLHGVLEPDELRSMMRDEARIAGLLRHPNVVAVHDVGEDEEGAFLVMDYVEGVPLGVLVRAARGRGELIPAQICLQIVRQAAEGLHAAHELCALDGTPLELVHRDVSPSNVLVDLDGVVRVVDFGIAKATGRRTRTSTGLLKGKIGYLAPEVLRFETPNRRADLYALGVVLYELLAGRRLYTGPDSSEVARRVLHEPAPDLGEARPELPAAMTELCFELMAKEPEHRPASAREVAQRLDVALRELLETEEPIALSDYVAEYVDTAPILDRRRRAERLARPTDDAPPAAVEPPAAPSVAPSARATPATDDDPTAATRAEPGSLVTAGAAPARLRTALVLGGVTLVLVGLGLGLALRGPAAVAGAPVAGAPVAGAPVAGAPVAGAPVAGAEAADERSATEATTGPPTSEPTPHEPVPAPPRVADAPELEPRPAPRAAGVTDSARRRREARPGGSATAPTDDLMEF